MTRSPGVFSTGIGSPVTIDSSTALAPSSTTPSTGHLLAGPHAQPIAGLRPARAARPPRRRRREPPRGLRREAEQRRIAAPVRLRARSSSTWPSSTSVTMTAGRLEVDRRLAAVRRGTSAGTDPGSERRDQAVAVADADAEPDQREHVEAAVHDRLPSRARRTASRPRARPASPARAGSSSAARGIDRARAAARAASPHREEEQRQP